jgi:hypothetical protein
MRILIYSDNIMEHQSNVKQILEALRAACLHLKPEKSLFQNLRVRYLGLNISDSGVEMDLVEVEAVTSWPVPMKLKGVQGFLRFANFYRRFIRDYSKILKPLTELTKPDHQFL